MKSNKQQKLPASGSTRPCQTCGQVAEINIGLSQQMDKDEICQLVCNPPRREVGFPDLFPWLPEVCEALGCIPETIETLEEPTCKEPIPETIEICEQFPDLPGCRLGGSVLLSLDQFLWTQPGPCQSLAKPTGVHPAGLRTVAQETWN